MKKLLNNKYIQFVLAITTAIFIYKCFNNLDDITNFLGYLWDVFFPCTLGLIFALFLYKPVCFFQKTYSKNKLLKQIALPLSIISVFAIIITFLTVLINFIFPPIYENLQEFINQVPTYYVNIRDFLNNNEYTKNLLKTDLFLNLLPKILNFDNINRYISIIADLANWFVTLFVSLVLSVYILIEKDRIISFLSTIRHKFFTSKRSDIIITYIKKTLSLFYSYFTGLFIDATIMGILLAIIFTFFKVPYAPILGLVVGIGNLIPFFGPIVAAIIVFIISAITLSPLTAIWLLFVQLIVGQLDANLIQPKIISQSIGVSPLLVLISVSVFGSLWGAAGMIVGVPTCALVQTIVVDYLEDGIIDGKSYKEKKESTNDRQTK